MSDKMKAFFMEAVGKVGSSTAGSDASGRRVLLTAVHLEGREHVCPPELSGG